MSLTVGDAGTGGAGGGGGTDGSPDMSVADATDAGGDAGDGSTMSDAGPTTCPSVTFVAPADGVTLGAADDSSGDNCANGFQYNVVVNADGGGTLELLATAGGTTTSIGTSVAVNGKATFANVSLPKDDTTTLSIKIGTMTCAATLDVTVDCTTPTVSIVAPVTDVAPFADVAKRLLAATDTQDFKDQVVATPGAQTDVVACTNRSGTVKLFAGHMGDPMLTQLGTDVATSAATPADGCTMGLSFVAKFAGVTLPESTEAADGTLTAATEISVAVTNSGTPTVTVSSDPTDLWVDSVAPTLTEMTPTPLCGSVQAADAIFTTNVTLNSTTADVTLTVTNSAVTPPTPVTFGPPTFATGVATFNNVAFPQGQNTIVATANDAAGNTTILAPPAGMTSCTLTVGSAPVVTFVSPPPGSKLCAVGNSANGCLPDSNLAVPGWQNPISVKVTTSAGVAVTTGNVLLVINGGAPQTVAVDGTGTATLTGATIPEGSAIVITATTDNAPPVGTANQSLVVDTLPPAAPTGLAVTTLDRRQTSFTIGWTAPADQGQPAVAGYDLHVKKASGTPLTCGAEVKAVPFTTMPLAATMPESVAAAGLLIETDYCFTVTALDAVGNVSQTTTAMDSARFQVTTLSVADSLTQVFGNVIDGTGDFGGPGGGGFANDRLSDLLVGPLNGQSAYLYFGRPGKTDGYPATPDVVFTGPPTRRFGAGVVNAGDLDGDGLNDIAIGSPGLAATDPSVVYIFSRKNAPWAVSGGWPATVPYTQASYVITADATYGGSQFGTVLARMGNFDGLGRDDLAIGATSYDMGPNGTNAGRVVIVKGSDTFASLTLPDATNTIVIDGETTGDQLGRGLEVLGDNTFVVSAFASMTSAGKLYAFRWPLLPTLVASATTAYDLTIYGSANGQYGFAVSTLGALGQSPAVVTASAVGAGGNFVDVHIPSAADGTFGGAKGGPPVPAVRFISSTTGNSVGIVNIASASSGSPSVGSFIGDDAIPDLVLAGQADPVNAIYIVSGATIPTLAGTVDLADPTTPGVLVLKNKLPTGWTGYGRGSFILDLNGDGRSDFAIAESGNSKPGRALIFW